jgi:leucyl/phenylalanyl-tRNA---protein transferase
MMFGESMFSRQSDASKIALAELVVFCREHEMSMIDCQQDTPHLASMGAELIERRRFSQHLRIAVNQTAPSWKFLPVYWRHLLGEPPERA